MQWAVNAAVWILSVVQPEGFKGPNESGNGVASAAISPRIGASTRVRLQRSDLIRRAVSFPVRLRSNGACRHLLAQCALTPEALCHEHLSLDYC